MSRTRSDDSKRAAEPGWGHDAGFLALGDGKNISNPAAASDRSLIIERLHRYCWSYDERRLEQLGDCFTEDAVWEGNVTGAVPVGPFSGRSSIVDWLSKFWPHQHEQRRHMIMNTVVEEQTDERATTLSYILLMAANPTGVDLKTSGFYRVNFRCSAAVWRIEHLFGGFDAPFWPGQLENLSARGRARHGIASGKA